MATWDNDIGKKLERLCEGTLRERHGHVYIDPLAGELAFRIIELATIVECQNRNIEALKERILTLERNAT